MTELCPSPQRSVIQYWFSALPLAHRDFSRFFMIPYAVANDIFKVFPAFCCPVFFRPVAAIKFKMSEYFFSRNIQMSSFKHSICFLCSIVDKIWVCEISKSFCFCLCYTAFQLSGIEVVLFLATIPTARRPLRGVCVTCAVQTWNIPLIKIYQCQNTADCNERNVHKQIAFYWLFHFATRPGWWPSWC